MARVELQEVWKEYPAARRQTVPAVRGVTLDAANGEFLVLVGPSGCGKTTLLRMIAGLEEIDRGVVRIGDQVVNEVEPKDRDVAMVFQNYALYPHMTVRENMAFALELRKVSKADVTQRVNEVAESLGLTPYLERLPKALSGGQRQRVAVGRAVVRNPKVFLFDEPLSNLDAQMRTQMRAEISRLHLRLKATMIYVTHDQVEAMTLGDRIAVLHEGQLQQVASPLELYNHPANAFVARFIGSPPMNLFPGRVVNENGSPTFVAEGEAFRVAVPDRAKLNGQFVQLGVRPEYLVPVSEGASGSFKATVDLVEMTGPETFVHLAIGNQIAIMKCPAGIRPTVGEALSLTFASEGLRFFSVTDGAALR